MPPKLLFVPKTSTFIPKRLNACPNSKPITPGPNTATLSGSVSHENTSSLTITLSPKSAHCGNKTGREPVAITIRSALICV